jgi:hypothetical protein
MSTKTTKTKLPIKIGKESSPKTSSKVIKESSVSVRTTKTIYKPVSHHIYHDGNSYRVRVIRKGIKFSRYFTSKKKAFEFRKSVLSV